MAKRLGVFAAALLLCLSLAAQERKIPKAVIPALPHNAPTIQGFVPAGWQLQTQVAGDLNGDGLPDAIFVLHQMDKRNVVDNTGGIGGETLDTNPRLLCVAFRGAGNSGYTLTLQNATLIPRYTESNMDDYFGDEGGLTVGHGTFSVKLHFFANAGGWAAGDSIYTFRYQNKRFDLIGFESSIVHRNSGETVDTSANFSTRRVSITSGTVENDKKRTVWKRLPAGPLLTIDQLEGSMELEGLP